MKRFKASVLAGVLALVATIAYATSTTVTDQIMSQSGGPVGFPAGITLPTSDVGDLNTGTYTATAATSTNVDTVANPTLNYIELGGQVAVWGQVSVSTTTDNTAGAYTLTLPLTRAAVFSGTTEAAGFNGSSSLETGVCTSTDAARTVKCHYYADGTGTQTVQVMFLYDKT